MMSNSLHTVAGAGSAKLPFCVDLDGTLVRDDTFWLALVMGVKESPLTVLHAVVQLLLGRKADAKSILARKVIPDPSILLYREPVLEWIESARADGQPVWLVTASDVRVAQAIASHLGGFDRVVASDGLENLKGPVKALRLDRELGRGGFDYAGDADADFAIWKLSRRVYAVASSTRRERKIRSAFPDARIAGIHSPRLSITYVARLLRVKQWSKNLLVLIPLLTAHIWASAWAWEQALQAVAVFCLGCSAIYIINDLLDIPSDRRSVKKCRRPIACGDISVPGAILVASVLSLACGLLLCSSSESFVLVFGVYWALTFVYSLWLKRMLLVDVFLLAAFYVLRVVAGAAAVTVPLSNWLLSFSAFTFLSLGLLKRYGEIVALNKPEDDGVHGRAYRREDALVLGAVGVGCAIGAAIMLALFVDSSSATGAYARPQFLWLGCPLFLFWLARLWLLAGRGAELDDPIAFALTDRASYAVCALLGIAFCLSL